MTEVKCYKIEVGYKILRKSTFNVHALDEAQAETFALAEFEDTHTDECLSREILTIKELKRK